MKLHQLPVDLLRCISDFSGTAACSHMCAQMWYFLQQRDLRNCIRYEQYLSQMMEILCMQALRTASLSFCGNGDKGAQVLAGLKEALALVSHSRECPSINVDLVRTETSGVVGLSHEGDRFAPQLKLRLFCRLLGMGKKSSCANPTAVTGQPALRCSRHARVLHFPLGVILVCLGGCLW